MSKEKLFPLAKSEGENEVDRLLERVIDRDKFSYNDAKAFAIIYQNLAPGDVAGVNGIILCRKMAKKNVVFSTYFFVSQIHDIIYLC